MPEPSNGHQENRAVDACVDTITLVYNRITDNLEIRGKTHSVDLALDMLARARRGFEFQQRKAQALEIQEAARQATENARIAAALRNQR